ncbi:hypothetical protein MASR2M78_13320 [Treponema sp.]
MSPALAFADETLRCRIRIDLEPVYGQEIDVPYPLDTKTAHLRALEEAALTFAGMMYGWDFDYEIGERARKIEEKLEMVERGSIRFGDPRLSVTDAELEKASLFVWAEYRTDETQQRRLDYWKTGLARNVQAMGKAALAGWADSKKAALEDAARAALRALLRSNERNRPKRAIGAIALAEAPRYWIAGGHWLVSARFRALITEIIPFSAY